MTKILTVDGLLIDTIHYDFEATDCEVRAWPVYLNENDPAVNPICAFEGSGQECRNYLRRLAALAGAYEYKDGGFHRIGGPNE